MPRRALVPHPDFPHDGARAISVEAERPGPRELALRYELGGATPALVVPQPASPVRTDELWKHTCFECFVMKSDGRGYYEFNLSPSGAWAAYAFDGYRDGMRPAPIAAPRIELSRPTGGLELAVKLDLAGLPGLVRDAAWRLALAAVIEGPERRLSYWSLAHGGGRPDFHAEAGFDLDLALTERP